IQKLTWGADGWPRTLDGSGDPTRETPGAGLVDQPWPTTPVREDFDGTTLPIDFQWLRTPYPETIFSLTARPGFLRLYGRESLGSVFTQALVARRQQAHCYSAATRLDFEPAHFQQAAGLVCYYNGSKLHYLHVTHDDEAGKHLRVMTCTPDSPQGDSFTAPIPLGAGPVDLRVEVDFERLRFGFRQAGGDWRWLPEVFDASILSDEATAPGAPNFTGAFVGMACQDMSGMATAADFDWFDYQERDYVAQWPA
ncbi:MAG: glycoside hydrolase 43 family protein, partial [Caulobacter sp.]